MPEQKKYTFRNNGRLFKKEKILIRYNGRRKE